MNKNRIWMLSMVLTLCIGFLSSCGKSNTTNQVEETKKFKVVCTIFPQYDWVKELVGEKITEYELTLLLDNAIDLHNYQPTAEDVAKISECDLFIYVGGESDGWVENALKNAKNDKMQVINLVEVLGEQVREEEIVEGMEVEEHEHEEEDEHAHEEKNHDGENEHEDENLNHMESAEYDEHVWLSLKNAKTITEKIEQALERIDIDNAEKYKENYTSYVNELDDLDMQYQKMTKKAKRNTILVGDRFPFRYLANDYGLEYYAAFVGCSAETEASFETITFLAKKVEELDLPMVLVLENSDKKLANVIIESTATKHQKVLVMNSLQSITNKEIAGEVSYLSVMQENLTTLEQALN